ncbi:ferrous iron transport protein A [Solidesulfovibrio fructosivorans JJ]]|uniref:Ferrous iron transport protein A n=1 Tax=Solidesulfovibrio fructosivorans JJ] TaxID=596151 RepID=E1JX00_SOLFR|nr:hypothetical protein [Solidesulfovibrio fructosivorans]EFL51204.1 ferrous iron transport protein A [Solidesulfovibrio fructosivorans JJ]]
MATSPRHLSAKGKSRIPAITIGSKPGSSIKAMGLPPGAAFAAPGRAPSADAATGGSREFFLSPCGRAAGNGIGEAL